MQQKRSDALAPQKGEGESAGEASEAYEEEAQRRARASEGGEAEGHPEAGEEGECRCPASQREGEAAEQAADPPAQEGGDGEGDEERAGDDRPERRGEAHEVAGDARKANGEADGDPEVGEGRLHHQAVAEAHADMGDRDCGREGDETPAPALGLARVPRCCCHPPLLASPSPSRVARCGDSGEGIMRRILLGFLLLLALPAWAQALRTEVVAGGLDHPWSIAFLPDGSALVTERGGGLRRMSGGTMTSIRGVPRVLTGGQGGLFDVRPHPRFAENRLVYLSYAHGTPRANGTRLARARLEGDRLAGLEVLWTATPMKRGLVHYGGRFLFLPDGTILITTGDGFDFREDAQRRESPLGKVMRLTDSGRPAPGNPFAGVEGALPEIFSLGHRNPQGLAFDPVRRLVYAHEHGPRGGDEVNILLPGRNYGWPVATRGRDYSGATISPFRRYPGMEEPLLDWTPSIAPSGLAVYRGAMFAEWNGDLLVGALVDREVRRVRLSPDGRTVLGQESLVRELGARIRDVAVAPDGALWIATDAPDGQILRVSRRAAP